MKSLPLNCEVKMPAGLHHSTQRLVVGFAEALAEKLAAAEKKYGYRNGWLKDDWEKECQKHLAEHVQKGDPRDVAAYCAFAWYHDWTTVDILDIIHMPTPTDSH